MSDTCLQGVSFFLDEKGAKNQAGPNSAAPASPDSPWACEASAVYVIATGGYAPKPHSTRMPPRYLGLRGLPACSYLGGMCGLG